MTRVRNVQVEFTEKELLLFAQSIYLSTICLRNPQWFLEDAVGIVAILDIMKSEKDWLSLGQKMLKTCLTVETTEGC